MPTCILFSIIWIVFISKRTISSEKFSFSSCSGFRLSYFPDTGKTMLTGKMDGVGHGLWSHVHWGSQIPMRSPSLTLCGTAAKTLLWPLVSFLQTGLMILILWTFTICLWQCLQYGMWRISLSLPHFLGLSLKKSNRL